jgi:hypothetical protein
MGLETGTYIDSLNTSNPGATDSVAQGDDHIRLLKSTIKNTFPNITGAMTSTHTELNLLDGVTANTTELNYVDIATLGTVEASKAVTADSNKDITGIRNLTVTGTITNSSIITLADVYPVGSIYINASVTTNPATLLGFGTWVAFGAGRVPVGQNTSDSDFNTLEETGGAKTHTLTTSQIPSHTHTHDYFDNNTGGPSAYGLNFAGNYNPITQQTTATGGGQSHNNLQPYIVVKMWKRTA